MTLGIFTQDKTFQEIQTACAVDVKRTQTSVPFATSSDGMQSPFRPEIFCSNGRR